MPRAAPPGAAGALTAVLGILPAGAVACTLTGPAGEAVLAGRSGASPLVWMAGAATLVFAAALVLAVRRRRAPPAVLAATVAALATTATGDGGTTPMSLELACGASRHYLAYSDGTERLLPAAGGSLELVLPAGSEVTLHTLLRGHRAGPLERFLGLPRPALPATAAEYRLAPTPAGEYQGQCPALCPGQGGHLTRLRLLDEAAFAAWQQDSAGLAPEQARRTRDELMRLGEQVYRRRCAACHGSRGQGVTGVYPGLRHSAMVRGPIEPHLLFQYYGRPGSPMKAFGEELTPLELAAVTTYQRNALGHATGDTVQPWMVELIQAPGEGK